MYTLAKCSRSSICPYAGFSLGQMDERASIWAKWCTPTIASYCFVYRIKNQIAKKGHSMTNRIEVTKDQALEVSCRARLPRCIGLLQSWPA